MLTLPFTYHDNPFTMLITLTVSLQFFHYKQPENCKHCM